MQRPRESTYRPRTPSPISSPGCFPQILIHQRRGHGHVSGAAQRSIVLFSATFPDRRTSGCLFEARTFSGAGRPGAVSVHFVPGLVPRVGSVCTRVTRRDMGSSMSSSSGRRPWCMPVTPSPITPLLKSWTSTPPIPQTPPVEGNPMSTPSPGFLASELTVAAAGAQELLRSQRTEVCPRGRRDGSQGTWTGFSEAGQRVSWRNPIPTPRGFSELSRKPRER